MNRRSAVTLVEVLIAMFIMALGLMSILALFPVGALQMAQALKDQRCAEAAANAAAWFRLAWKDACEIGGQGQPDPRQRFVIALSSPNQDDRVVVTGAPPFSLLDAKQNLGPPDPSVNLPSMNSGLLGFGGANNPSYPVYVDPIGWKSAPTSAQQWWVAGKTIPRRPFFARQQVVFGVVGANQRVDNVFLNLTTPQRILRQFSLLDDMSFTPDGKAQATGANQVIERQGKYTWAFLVRRQNNLVARQVDLTVVVYSGRSIDVASPETPYPATFDPTNPTSISLPYGGVVPKPALRRGWWVFDATTFPPQGFFYRVVNVNDETPGVVRLELQTPLKAGSAQRTMVVMDNVAEVFEKGTIDPKEEIRPF
jgi:hypothetical protein